jgi:hypothetical protein
MMIEGTGSGAESGSGSIPLTNGSGYGSATLVAANEKSTFRFFIGINFFKDNFAIISSVCKTKC